MNKVKIKMINNIINKNKLKNIKKQQNLYLLKKNHFTHFLITKTSKTIKVRYLNNHKNKIMINN